MKKREQFKPFSARKFLMNYVKRIVYSVNQLVCVCFAYDMIADRNVHSDENANRKVTIIQQHSPLVKTGK